jgi:hypothetical protein
MNFKGGTSLVVASMGFAESFLKIKILKLEAQNEVAKRT